MDNNDLLRRLRYALRCDDANTSRLIKLGGGTTSTRQAAGFRAKESDPDFIACNANVIANFLDGLILDYRGPKDTPAASPWPDRTRNKQTREPIVSKQARQDVSQNATTDPMQIDNNVVLKQLRIALSLRSDDVHAILKAGGSAMSASEASALFRKPDARNFRQCGDQVLRQFIAGLVKRREDSTSEQNTKDS